MPTRREFLRLGVGITTGVVYSTNIANGAEPISRKDGSVLKVGCAAYSYRKYLTAKEQPITLEDFLDTAAEVGCDGVEITSYYFPNPVTKAYLNNLKRRAFLLGLEIAGMSVRNNFCLPPGDKRAAEVSAVCQWINRASELGAPCIRIFAGDPPKGTPNEDAARWVAECVDACANAAEKNGVMLALENHGAFTGDVENFLTIVKAVKTDWFGVNLDTGNFRGVDPYRDIEKAAPYAITTHVKTTVSPQKPADYKRIANILKHAGYRGYLILEYEAPEEPRTAIPEVIKALKEAV
ncbi:MAG: sugar phosphate isomerase/epimerase family protein [Armatimonadota bacterium]|nr:sugar phosphate isomerase/epimerase family protein [Armatimonadota bacterium]